MSRQSIQPTYDSRETGDRYHVTTHVGFKTIEFQKRIPDPFVRQTVHLHWRDLLRGLFRGGLKVEVTVGADPDVMEDVLDLDANNLGLGNSTRRQQWNADLNKAMTRMAKEDEAAEADGF